MVALSVPMIVDLPPGCTSAVIGGVNYFSCGGVFYRAGFQGKQRRVYSVSPLRARSPAAEKDFQKIHASTKPVLSKAEGLSTNGQ